MTEKTVYDPVELVKDLADKIGIHQLYAIAEELKMMELKMMELEELKAEGDKEGKLCKTKTDARRSWNQMILMEKQSND